MSAEPKPVKLTMRYCKTCKKGTPQERIANRNDLPSPRWFCYECFMNPDTEVKKK